MGDTYDAIPYDSQPFSDARPASLAALAALHGLEPADPARAHVLDLGCASGGHIIPLAFFHPEARFTGIDLSAEQIRQGRELVTALKLGNCDLRQGDVCALDLPDASVDYVVAHGLYSWVPDAVRGALLEQIRRVLAPGGIAYISYNEFPGWRRRGALRDLLLWHVRDHDTPEARGAAVAALIGELAPALDDHHPLATELARVSRMPVSYLVHEYLETNNQPFHLHEFAARTASAGLRYVCDVALNCDLPGFYGESVEALLAGVNDPVEQAQYLDFFTDRGFRQSLLCRDDAPHSELNLDRFRGLWLLSDLQPRHKCDLRRAKAQAFMDPNGQTTEVVHPLAKSVLSQLADAFPRAVSIDAALETAAAEVRRAGNAALAQQADEALSELFTLVAYQVIDLVTDPGADHPARDGALRANDLARHQARLGWSHTATLHHRVYGFDPFIRELLGLLDGTLDREGLIAALVPRFAPGQALAELAPPGNADNLRRQIAANLDRVLGSFGRNGLLR